MRMGHPVHIINKDNMEEKKKNHEIDIIALLKQILEDKYSLIAFLMIFAVIGIVVALARPKEYTADVILAPEMSSGGLGMSETLADMASSFGINLDGKSSMDAIYPEIYPTVLSSHDFILDLFDVPVQNKDENKPKSYIDHIKLDSKLPFWEYPAVWLRRLAAGGDSSKSKDQSTDSFRLTKEEENIVNKIRYSVACVVDKKTSIITISVTDQDPLVAAIMADTIQHRLQNYITEYRTKKARKDVAYYTSLFKESKADYIKAQQKYASYSDANEDILLEAFKSKREQLENEMQLRYNIYTQVATQLQASKAKVQENTPAFTIVETPTMPNHASSTPRTFIVIMFLIFGFIIDALWVLYGKDQILKKMGNK